MAALLLNRRKVQKLNEGLSEHFHEHLKVPEYQPLLFTHFHSIYKMYIFFVPALATHFFSVAIPIAIMALTTGKYGRMFPGTIFANSTLSETLNDYKQFCFPYLKNIYTKLTLLW